MKKIDSLLPDAEEALVSTEIVKGLKVQKKAYANAIISFGAMVITIGIYPTILIYLSDKDKTTALNAIARTIEKESAMAIKYECKSFQENKEIGRIRLLTKDLLEASVALKMVMRTFEIPEKDK